MVCSKCSKEIMDNAVICPFCKEPTKNMTVEIANSICEQGDDESIYLGSCILFKINTIKSVKQALKNFKKIEGYKQSKYRIVDCINKIEKLEEIENNKTRKNTMKDIKSTVIVLLGLFVGLCLLIGVFFVINFT
ncbi:hypothetical protein [uncultured Eubacterium sp.]|uniref:hypothetical protein n=1 Tax=uncultured Eubacterium sp. TaxID=165185 RepID=UPI0025FEDDBC|nr:hypothetical protein [uncultured Eubacterium sp.]